MTSLAALAEHVKTTLSATLLVADGAVSERGWTGGWQGTPGQSDYRGYIVLTDISGGGWDGPAGLPRDDLTAVYQAQCVGGNARQARTVADLTRTGILALRRTQVDGQVVTEVSFDFGTDTVLADRDVSPAVFYIPLRFRLVTTPT